MSFGGVSSYRRRKWSEKKLFIGDMLTKRGFSVTMEYPFLIGLRAGSVSLIGLVDTPLDREDFRLTCDRYHVVCIL